MTNLLGQHITIADDTEVYTVVAVSYDTMSETLGFVLLLKRGSDGLLKFRYIDQSEDTWVIND